MSVDRLTAEASEALLCNTLSGLFGEVVTQPRRPNGGGGKVGPPPELTDEIQDALTWVVRRMIRPSSLFFLVSIKVLRTGHGSSCSTKPC
jgi:hypothetical protein